jgi:hypothetical protein
MRRVFLVVCCIGVMDSLIGCASTSPAIPLTQKEADDTACEAAGYAFATYQYNECRRRLREERGEESEPDGNAR